MPGWLFSLSAQIYAAHTLTLSKVRDLPKNSQRLRTSNVIYKLRPVQMMASLLCGVMNLCHRPESALLSHTKLRTALGVNESHAFHLLYAKIGVQ